MYVVIVEFSGITALIRVFVKLKNTRFHNSTIKQKEKMKLNLILLLLAINVFGQNDTIEKMPGKMILIPSGQI